MKPSDANEQTIFDAARQMPDPSARVSYLDAVCAGHPGLRERVEKLLQAGQRADEFLAGDPLRLGGARRATVLVPPMSEGPGTVVGRYKLLEKLGEGGCGVVYMAEQEEPVRRRVALKIIRPGMDSREVVARFEAERQALAMMDHPNIAKVHDGGVTDTGRPFFVMELVRGVRITDYCQEHALSTRERLDLFLQVCSAVQHAHQKGIIHRDLKPSNILVTETDGQPLPKVIDFGIAKATEQKLTDKTLFTQFAQFIGTPAYMSPEQAAMTSVDIDTRSDIYSLGVLLYELLTGTTPFDTQELLKAGFDEMRRVIRETEPEKPSTRLTQARSQTASDAIGHPARRTPRSTFDQDLDWIVLKCLEKDRSRRYETANGLAADLQRHLSNEPVVARPPSAAYRFRKIVRRNKVAFIAGAVVATALMLGLGLFVWQFVEKEKAYRRVQTESAKSQRVAKFLKDMIRGAEPSIALGRDSALLEEIAERTLEQLAQEKDVPPEVDVELRSTIAGVFHVVRETRKAEAMYREILPRMRAILGNEHPQVAGVLLELACVQGDRGQHRDSESLARDALALSRKLLGPEHPDVARALYHLANSLAGQKRLAEAETLMRQALEMRRRLHGPEHSTVSSSLCRLAAILGEQGRHQEAEPLFREALVMIKKLRGETHPDVAQVLDNFADARFTEGKMAEAEALYKELVTIRRTLLGNEHRTVGENLGNLAGTLVNNGKHAEAEPLAREALLILRKTRGDQSYEVAMTTHHLSMALAGQARLEEAEALMREALAMQRKLLRPDSGILRNTLRNLGRILIGQRKLAEAEPVLRERMELARSQAAIKPDELARRLHDLADVLYRQGKFGEAETVYRERLQVLQAQPVSDNGEIAATSASLGRLLADWAWAERSRSADIIGIQRGSDDGTTRPQGRAPVELAREGERLLRDALAARLNRTNATPWTTSEWKSRLGGALVSVAVTDLELGPAEQQAKLAEAETLLLEGHEAGQQRRSADRQHKRDTIDRLVRLYETCGKPVKAAEWRAKLRTLDEENQGFKPVP